MLLNVRSIIKIIIINFFIFLLIIIIIEIFLGDWFKNDFKFKINSERNIDKIYKFNFSNHEGVSRYKRDKFGFRVEEKINPTDIDIIFLGGSTINEKFTKYEETIVGLVQKKIIKNKSTYKVVNGGIDGMTIVGHINSFNYWFDKIKDFKPKIYVYYIGLNDSFLQIDNLRDVDYLEEKSPFKKIKYFIISNSFTIKSYRNLVAELNKKLNLNIGIREVSAKVYGERDSSKFITWQEYSKTIQEKKLNDDELLFYELYLEKIKTLNSMVKERNGMPIFITQTSGTGLTDRLYNISKIIINFCATENLICFDLAKELDLLYEDFYDWGHLNPVGSKKVANYIFKNLLDNKIIFSQE